jgi:hypothetical protein
MIGLEDKKGQFQQAVETKIKNEKNFEVRDINSKWNQIKEAITIGAKEVYGFQKARIAKKPWITSEMLHKMDERRKWKNNATDYGKQVYSRLNNDLRRTTDKARDQWWNDKCDELVEYDKSHRSDLLYQEVRKLTRTGQKVGTKNITINNKNGELKTELNEVKERWREYVEDLYDKTGKPVKEDFDLEEENMVGNDQKGPDIMREEIYEAIKCMKKGKAAGIDDVPWEFLTMIEGETLRKLVDFSLCLSLSLSVYCLVAGPWHITPPFYSIFCYSLHVHIRMCYQLI